MTDAVLEPATAPLRGELRVPGDKSISHRAVLFAAMAEGTSRLTGVLDSADVRSTIAAVSALGARVRDIGGAEGGLALDVTGWGAAGPTTPAPPIYCGNSGTTARLLMGVLCSWPGRAFELTGDESLSGRPMARVADPLRGMGAEIELSDRSTLPGVVRGAALVGTVYDSPVASAQVKSAILLAGTNARGRTMVREPAASRDHTERLLPAFGVAVGVDESEHFAWIDGPVALRAATVDVPGDPSSAAFLLGAALITPGSDLTVTGVGLNPTRIGFLRVLERMGADVVIRPVRGAGSEPVGDVRARRSALRGTVVTAGEVPSLVDEVPLLAVVATRAEGTTRFEGVAELRVKESDRLAALAEALGQLGAVVRSGDDWLEVDGPARLRGASLDSLGDHRLAMSYAVAALVADAPVTVARYEAVGVSYPGFPAALGRLSQEV